MKFEPKIPPRSFMVGRNPPIPIQDCGTMALADGEQITLVSEGGREYDVVRKDWGYYATPSLNGRLERFGFRTALIRNSITGLYFILLVERGREEPFEDYLQRESLEVVAWMDNTAALDAVREKLIG